MSTLQVSVIKHQSATVNSITLASNGQVSFGGTVEFPGSSIYAAANGNVGIGNTTPNEKLVVNGQLNILSNTSTFGTSVYFVSNGNIGFGNSTPAVKLVLNSTDAIRIPVGSTAQRPTGVVGYLRFNNTTNKFEGFDGTTWSNIGSGTGGGSGDFNTKLTGVTPFAVNTTLSDAFTASSNTSLRHIIYSIHVTNIGTNNSEITCTLQGTNYSNIQIAYTVPVPKESSVELLKQPKVLNPSDIIRLQANNNSTLHAVIVYESAEDTDYFGRGIAINNTATYNDLYTATANCVLQSLLLVNTDGANDVKARAVYTDSSNNILGYYCFDLVIPADGTVEVFEKPKFLANGNKVRVYANVADRLKAIIAGKIINV